MGLEDTKALSQSKGTFTEAYDTPNQAKEGHSPKTRDVWQVQTQGIEEAQDQGQTEGDLGDPKQQVICPQLQILWEKGVNRIN